MLKSFALETQAKSQFIDITKEVGAIVRESGIESGVVRVFVPHTTAAVTINENADPSVIHDMLLDLDRIAPISQVYYRHREGNSSSHLKASLIGSCQTALVEGSQLVLGTWQGIYFCEFDGPRRRTVYVKTSGG